MDTKEFGKYIKGLRKKKGLTLNQLKDEVGLSQPYLSQIENGKKGILSPEILKKLSTPLGVDYEELMIKAGYWGKRYSEDDKVLFEKIYTEEWDFNNKIFSILKAITDDDGFFPDYIHKDIFQIFGGWLNLDDSAYRGFDKFYKYDYLDKSDEEGQYDENGIREINDYFNKIYNYTSVKNALFEYRGLDKDRDSFLEELIQLANRYNIPISTRSTEFLTQIELTDKILSDMSVIIRYNDNLLTKEERYRLIGFLDALQIISKTSKE